MIDRRIINFYLCLIMISLVEIFSIQDHNKKQVRMLMND
jgi:hypothetical protein